MRVLFFILIILVHGFGSCSLMAQTSVNIQHTTMEFINSETNYIKNPYARRNTDGVFCSNALPSRDTATNRLYGAASHIVDATAINGYCEYTLRTIEEPDNAGNCEFGGVILGDGSLYKAQILNSAGTSVLADSGVLGNNSSWREFYAIGPCQSAPKVRVTQTEAGTAPAIKLGLYYGKPRHLSQGTPPNEFTAQVAANGVVTNETPQDWINGNFVITDTSLFTGTYVSGLATSPMTCVTNFVGVELGANGRSNIETQTSTAVGVRTGYSQTSTSFTKQPYQFNIKCNKTGSDYVQNAVTAANWNFNWKDYVATVTTASGTFATYTLNNMQYRRTGGQMWIKGKITFTNASTWTGINIPYPSGITSSISDLPIVSDIVLSDVSAPATLKGTALKNNTTSVRLYQTGMTNITQASPWIWTTGDVVEWTLGPIDAIENGVSWTETYNALQLVGSVVYDTNVKAEKAAGVTTVDYGTYSATLTNVSNAASIVSPATCYFDRIGPKVNVTCRTSTGCTSAGGTSTQYNVTLPVATTQSVTITGSASMLGAVGTGGRIIDSGSNLAQVQFACQSTPAGTHNLIFSYQVP